MSRPSLIKLLAISTAAAQLDSPLGRLRPRALAQPTAKRTGAVVEATGDLQWLEWSLPDEDDLDDFDAVKRANPAPWIGLASHAAHTIAKHSRRGGRIDKASPRVRRHDRLVHGLGVRRGQARARGAARIALKPCIGCGVPSSGSRCPVHTYRNGSTRSWHNVRAGVLAATGTATFWPFWPALPSAPALAGRFSSAA